MTNATNKEITFMHEKLSMLMNMVQDAIITIDTDSMLVVEANPAACKLFLIRDKQFMAKPVGLLFNDLGSLRKGVRKATNYLRGFECIRGDGSVFCADLGIAYLKTPTQTYAMIFFYHIIDENQAEKDRQWRETLVLERIRTESVFFMGEDHERKRLARELHGHLGPMMFAVKMGLEQLLGKNKKYISRKQLKEILGQQTDAIIESRLITSRLSEAYQAEDNINGAITSLVKKFGDLGGLTIYCKTDTLPDDLAPNVRYHLIQIIEEGLTNTIKHAGATKVSFRLSADKQQLSMYLLDNGRGASGRFLKSYRGIQIMEQRAALIDGKLRIETAQNRYFKLSLSCPLYPQTDKTDNLSE